MYRRICSLLCALVISFALTTSLHIFAASSGVQESTLSDEEKASLWQSLSLEVMEAEPSAVPISCFDVNTEGQVVIGCPGRNTNSVSVYSNNGEFMYGFSFRCYGSFYVFWQEDMICIYPVRDEIIYAVDEMGKRVDIFGAGSAGIDTNTLSDSKFTTKQVNGIVYFLERDFPLGQTYGRLCVRNPDGAECVFYDASELHNSRIIFTISALALFMIVCAYLAFKQHVRKKKTCPEFVTEDGPTL